MLQGGFGDFISTFPAGSSLDPAREGDCSRRKAAREPEFRLVASSRSFSAWVLTFKIKTLARCALRCSALPPVGCPADPHRSWCVLRRRPAAEPSRRPSRPHFTLALVGRNWDNACDASYQLRRSFLSGPIQVPVRFWTRGPFSAHFREGSGERAELVSRLLSLLAPPSK